MSNYPTGQGPESSFQRDSHRYGGPGTSPAEEALPRDPLPDDLSNGWVPEDSRQRARSPFPPPALFSTQSLLAESLRKLLRHPGEIPWLIVGFCVTLAGYTYSLWILFFQVLVADTLRDSSDPYLQEQAERLTSSTIEQILAIIFLLPLIIFFSRGIMYAQLRISGVRISPTQFPEAYQMLVEAATAAGLRRVPDAYVVLGNGLINAFAAGHGHRRFVAVYSDLFEIGGRARDPEALRFIIGHEVGHIAAGHTSYFRLLGLSFFAQVPVLYSVLSRAQEYTADNFGYRYRPGGARGSIRVLAAGKYLNAEVNFDEFADRAVYERGPFVWMANLGGTHPALTWRAHALRDRSAPGRLIWRPRFNPPATPLSMVPAAEAAELWADPQQGERFIAAYPESAGNQHWGVNETVAKVPAEQRDRRIPDLLDTRWAAPGRRFPGGPGDPGAGGPASSGPAGPAGPETGGPTFGGPAGPEAGGPTFGEPVGPEAGGPAGPEAGGPTPGRPESGGPTSEGPTEDGPGDAGPGTRRPWDPPRG